MLSPESLHRSLSGDSRYPWRWTRHCLSASHSKFSLTIALSLSSEGAGSLILALQPRRGSTASLVQDGARPPCPSPRRWRSAEAPARNRPWMWPHSTHHSACKTNTNTTNRAHSFTIVVCKQHTPLLESSLILRPNHPAILEARNHASTKP